MNITKTLIHISATPQPVGGCYNFGIEYSMVKVLIVLIQFIKIRYPVSFKLLIGYVMF